MAEPAPLLEVRNLRAVFPTPAGDLVAVDGVGFEVRPRQRFGIVGESGSGKSVTALSLLGLVDPPGVVTADRLALRGRDLLAGGGRAMRQARGREMALVMQDPLTSLSPTFSVGAQLAETVRHRQGLGRRAAAAEAVELLARVGIPHPRQRADDFPHQLSGGMRQRVAVALALACRPALLIADEPTTALDVTIQAQVLELLARLSEERGMAVLIITHDLGLLAGFADEVAVMYAGRIVERGAVGDLYRGPRHPYTRALLASQPRIDAPAGERLAAIPGAPPDPLRRPTGCVYHPRCALRRGRERCREEAPALRPVGAGRHVAACHFAEELASADVLEPGVVA